jgi:hypothetical protein
MLNFTTESEATIQERRRKVIKAVLLRHRGEIAKIAKALGINKANISQYLNGVGRSKRVADACERRAIALLIAEEQAKIDAEHRPHDVSVREIIDELRNKGKQ